MPGLETQASRSPSAVVSIPLMFRFTSNIPKANGLIDRNTSLPHPDADTSPNASISQDDIAVSRALSRHRRSFMGKNHSKHTISSGRITAEMEQMYSDRAAAGSDSDCSPIIPQTSRLSGIPDSPDFGGANSFRSASTGDHEDGAPTPTSPRQDGSARRQSRRLSFFQKMGIRKFHE